MKQHGVQIAPVWPSHGSLEVGTEAAKEFLASSGHPIEDHLVRHAVFLAYQAMLKSQRHG